MILLAFAVAAAAPMGEAEALGLRLAKTGMLDAVAAMTTAKETEEVVKDHPGLSPAQQEKVRILGRQISLRHRDHLAQEMGRRYATALSIEDLRALVAFQESAAAQRYRAAMPQVLAGTMQGVGTIDFKGDLTKAFCAEAAAACAGWKR